MKSIFHGFSSMFGAVAVLMMSEEQAAGGMPEAAPEGAEGLETAPGCAPARPERIPFPPLQEIGGVFRAIPDASGGVHFDVNLIPMIEKKNADGTTEQVPGLPEWPRLIGEDGKPIPLPWESHNRLTHLALTRDCFDTETGYYLYRAFEAYQKAQAAISNYHDAKTGIQRSVASKEKKVATTMATLNALAGELSPEEQAQVAAVLALLQKRTAGNIGNNPAPETTDAPQA